MTGYTVEMPQPAPGLTEILEDAPTLGPPGPLETYAMPATQGQARFWALDQLNPGNPALNMPLMWKCTGDLNLPAMVEAFSECLRRHEVLRTTFALVDGQLAQIIHPPYAAKIPVVNLEGMEPEQRDALAEELTRDHAAFRFNLTKGPLLELKLLRFDERNHRLLVTMHHIICDGISNGILLRDMVEFYEARLSGRAAQLPELPIQFADFAVWQEQWLAGEEPAESLDFWHQSLGDDFRPIKLPRDADAVTSLARRREAWTGDIETLLIPPAMQARAHAFCIKENVTLNILLFSVFSALLARLTGQDDLLIGSPCANRTEDTEELIGLFMNIQVMRLRLEEGITFTSLLRLVQDWTLGAYEHQDLPFENLVHDPTSSGAHRSFELPIFFLYQKSFMITHQIGNLEIVPLRSESPGAVFEMMFAIVDRAEEGPRLQLEYNPRYFKASTIQRYLRMYVALLDAALSTPTGRVDELHVSSDEERVQLTSGWNGDTVDLGNFESVVSSFLRRATDTPERIAIECGPVRWTYAELRRRSCGLAVRMVAEGVKPGDRVGIAMARSPEMVAAMMAAMMTGAAYVPVDPRHPRGRLEATLSDAGVSLLLTSRTLELRVAANEMLVMPSEDVMEDEAFAPVLLAADSLAYVIYTSGSTGTPKGVAIEHGSLVNLLRAMELEPGLTASDTLVAITTLAFDIAALELLLPLMTGARLVIATDAEVQDGRLLCELLGNAKATVLQATPGAWRVLIDAGWAASNARPAPPLKALCGGEALPRDLADKLLARAGEVWNMYGPTETTIWSSATQVGTGTGPLRVGRPIANTQFYVLDGRRQPAPLGVTGELFIGGAGVARGYWNLPELTAAQFTANPFAPGRMYATGDLARRHDDGTLELLGRSDFQVKVRGYRIELAEIEAALMRDERVREAVVVQQKSESTGATSLIAYLAAELGTPEAAERMIDEVRSGLTESLPDYMIPTAFVTLPALPRNANGKLDRKALPAARANLRNSGVHSTASEDEDFVGPQDVIEAQVADIWQSTLGIPRISVRASFFSLGVGSLAALRLITKLNRVFAMDLGLASLISASTIETISELIRIRFAPNTASSLVPLQPLGGKPPLYIVHGVGGNVVNFYGLSMRMSRDQPVYGIQSQALLANEPALLHLKDMAAHYLEDMRKVQPHGPYNLLGYSFGGTVVLEMAHQLRAAGEEVQLLGMIDSKSKDYEATLAKMKSVPSRITHRVDRFRGNTGKLERRDQAKYIREKISTRAIRFACMAAAALHFKRVPAFMRSAYDINYVAVQNYRPRPYDGKLVLFRASEQEFGGPYDLGWGALFSDGVEIHDMPGDHERIFLEPNIDRLAEGLRSCLTRP